MQTGEEIWVKAYKSDGQPYRWWRAMVESGAPGQVVTVTGPGNRVEGPNNRWQPKWAIRSFYWPGHPFNLLEVYRPNGELEEIYIHIASPPRLEPGVLAYTDWELDVVRDSTGAVRLVDEDEFAQAARQFGYSADFQARCYRAAEEALALAAGWVAHGLPAAI